MVYLFCFLNILSEIFVKRLGHFLLSFEFFEMFGVKYLSG